MNQIQSVSTPNREPDRMNRRLFLALIGLLLVLGLVDWWYERHKEHRFDAQILRAAQHYGVSPALVKAVVWRESKFNPKVRGRVGEIGLMQIRPLTADEWSRSETHQRSFAGNLFEPETNLQIGAWYLSKLLKRYHETDSPAAFALADYNAGRSNVLRWKKGASDTNSAAFLESVSFPSTREYVRSILQRSRRYEREFKNSKVTA